MDLKGRVAVVTGASRGVGRAIADALEARSLVVAAVARHSARFTTDVSDPAAVTRERGDVMKSGCGGPNGNGILPRAAAAPQRIKLSRAGGAVSTYGRMISPLRAQPMAQDRPIKSPVVIVFVHVRANF